MLLSLGMLMLSATQVYTIFTVQLFAFLNLLPVEADIVAYSFDNKTETFDDMPARFGYRLPSDGLKRSITRRHEPVYFLMIPHSEDGCIQSPSCFQLHNAVLRLQQNGRRRTAPLFFLFWQKHRNDLIT
ncbi:hypothetical protein CCH79_00014998 [Gambusia affinis]|uniref:Uncharacterized protein n=1 Tax=Gambusia affinis TaxID=33528 RepID=A0A315USK4_GAMAF|nr:hypothetical protein CCH79_00014998 [Gambusia affinis]